MHRTYFAVLAAGLVFHSVTAGAVVPGGDSLKNLTGGDIIGVLDEEANEFGKEGDAHEVVLRVRQTVMTPGTLNPKDRRAAQAEGLRSIRVYILSAPSGDGGDDGSEELKTQLATLDGAILELIEGQGEIGTNFRNFASWSWRQQDGALRLATQPDPLLSYHRILEHYEDIKVPEPVLLGTLDLVRAVKLVGWVYFLEARENFDAVRENVHWLSKQWSIYAKYSRVVYPWELWVNDWLYDRDLRRNKEVIYADGQFDPPPPRQIVLLHPYAGFELSNISREGADAVVMLDILGNLYRARQG
jgi:hypothetical protein